MYAFVFPAVLLQCYKFSTHIKNEEITLFFLLFSHQTEDEIEAYYRTKYGDSSAVERFGEGEEMSDEITQQGLLPGVK